MTTKIDMEHQRLSSYQSYLVIGFLAVLGYIVVPGGDITYIHILLILLATVIFFVFFMLIHYEMKKIENED